MPCIPGLHSPSSTPWILSASAFHSVSGLPSWLGVPPSPAQLPILLSDSDSSCPTLPIDSRASDLACSAVAFIHCWLLISQDPKFSTELHQRASTRSLKVLQHFGPLPLHMHLLIACLIVPLSTAPPASFYPSTSLFTLPNPHSHPSTHPGLDYHSLCSYHSAVTIYNTDFKRRKDGLWKSHLVSDILGEIR